MFLKFNIKFKSTLVFRALPCIRYSVLLLVKHQP